MDTQHLRATVEGIAARFPEITLVYLFGSRVAGNTGPLSDWDFGVLTTFGAPDEEALGELGTALARALDGAKVDLVPLRRAPIELAYNVIATGDCLFRRDEAARVEYEAYVLGRYGDYLPVLREQRSHLLDEDDHERRVQWHREALERTRRALGKIGAAARPDQR